MFLHESPRNAQKGLMCPLEIYIYTRVNEYLYIVTSVRASKRTRTVRTLYPEFKYCSLFIWTYWQEIFQFLSGLEKVVACGTQILSGLKTYI